MFIISFLTNKEEEFSKELRYSIRSYQDLFKRLLLFSNNKVSDKYLNNDILFTKYTKDIEESSIKYFDIGIDPSLTEISLNLKSGNININNEEIIRKYTKELLDLIINSIYILDRINNYIKDGKVFLTIYQSVITHMLNENKLLKETLERLYNGVGVDPTYIYTLEYYYTSFLREHSMLIKNLINPTKNNEIIKSSYYMDKYNELLNSFDNEVSPYSINDLYDSCTYITNEFNSFLDDVTKTVKKDSSSFMLLPLLIDHLLRESNSYIKNLNYLYKNS